MSNFFALIFSFSNTSTSSFVNSTFTLSNSSFTDSALPPTTASWRLATTEVACLLRLAAVDPIILPVATFLRLSLGPSSWLLIFCKTNSQNFKSKHVQFGCSCQSVSSPISTTRRALPIPICLYKERWTCAHCKVNIWVINSDNNNLQVGLG